MTSRHRVIPVLLLSGRSVVKSSRFGDRRYIGDYLNAARIFSELEADELIVLDIDATPEGRTIDTDVVGRIADEISMPLTAGGGLRDVDAVSRIIAHGAEKVVLGAGAWSDPYSIKEVADRHGSSAVSICIDVKRERDGTPTVRVQNARHDTGIDPVAFARTVEDHGAGEIILQSVDRDGAMCGYDVQLTASVARTVGIPVVALGGAGSREDLSTIITDGNASAAAAGSLFVYFGSFKGVLINYPSREEALCS